MLKFIDLFAGVGGFHYAFKNLAECVFAAEWDEKARLTYLANWGEDLHKNNAIFAKDINNIDYKVIPDFDILCAGFPCQPFSIAGKREGFNHEKQGNLFFNIVDIIKEKSPKVVFLENVKNLISHDKGNTFKVIISELEKLGYFVHYKVLNSLDYANIPQNRERIFIVAFKNKEHFLNFNFPEKIQFNESFKNFLEKGKINNKYYQTNIDSPSVKKMITEIKNKDSVYQYRRCYVRENKSNVCPTLTANMGTGGHNVPLILDNFGIRKLTPKECFNLQGYPESFILPKELSDSALYKQAGNSVVCSLVKRISFNIIKATTK